MQRTSPNVDLNVAAHTARLDDIDRRQTDFEYTVRDGLNRVNDKLDSLKMWLLALIGSAAVSLLLLAINLLRK
jgi:hypothetical protein